MLRFMERSTIHYLKQKGWTNVQIAEFTGHHRNTVAQVLREEVEKKSKTRNRSSACFSWPKTHTARDETTRVAVGRSRPSTRSHP